MRGLTRTKTLLYLGFSGLILSAYLINLGNAPLTEQSEARYAEVAWEMAMTGDFLTPRYNFIKHFHKPPLYYWSLAACYRLFGVTDLAARLPCTLAALLCLGLTGWLAHRELGMDRRQALLAVGMLAGSPFFWEMARVSVTDMFVTLFVLISIAAFGRLVREPDCKVAWWLFWLANGLNFLTKGPVGPALVLAAIIPYCLLQQVTLRHLRALPGIFVASGICLPWYVWAIQSNPGLLAYFLKFQTLDRVLTTVHGRDGPLWYYLPVLLGGFLPWTPWLVVRIISLIKGRALKPPDQFLVFWVVLPTLFFSLMGSKLPPYVLPVFPALAILTARGVVDLGGFQLRWPALIFVGAGAFAAAQSSLSIVPRLNRYNFELTWAATLLLLVGMTGCWWFGKVGWTKTSLAVVATMLCLELVAGIAYPKISHRTAKPLADAILAMASVDFEVAMYRRYLFGLPLYVHQQVIHVQHERETEFESGESYRTLVRPSLGEYLKEFRRGDKDRFLIVARPDWAELRTILHEPIVFSDERYLLFHHSQVETQGARESRQK